MALKITSRSILAGVVFLVLTGCGSDQPNLSALTTDATILAFGDSLTKGTGAASDQSYPAILSRLSGITVVNAGMPGELSSDGLQRLPNVLQTTQPQLMILCHGGNDMLRKKDLQAAARNIESMIALAQAQNVEVLLIGVPRPGLFLGTADMYLAIAAHSGIPAENDVLSDIISDPSLKSDPIHPNGKGYQRMAEAVLSLLQDTGAL
jgi:lysophospholipase L1-like esterase